MSNDNQLQELLETIKKREEDIEILSTRLQNVQNEIELLEKTVAENLGLVEGEQVTFPEIDSTIKEELEKKELSLEDVTDLVIYSDKLFSDEFKVNSDGYTTQLLMRESKMNKFGSTLENLRNLSTLVLKGVELDVPQLKIFKFVTNLEIHTQLANFSNLHVEQFTETTRLALINAQYKREGYELTKLVRFNYVLTLPQELQMLKKIQTLTIDAPFLISIPEIFSEMNKLEFFEITNSSITELPNSFYKVPSLKHVKIHSFTIMRISSLAELENLFYFEYAYFRLDAMGDFHRTKIPIQTLDTLKLSMFPRKLGLYYCFLYNYEYYRKGMALEPLYTATEMLELRKKFTRKLIIHKNIREQGYYFNDLLTLYCDEFPDYLEQLTNITEIGFLGEKENVKIPDTIMNLPNLETIYTDLEEQYLEMSNEVREFIKPKMTSFGDKRDLHLVSYGPFGVIM